MSVPGKRSVCLIDTLKNTDALSAFLSEQGCDIATCPGGASACERQGCRPDVILMNCHARAAATRRIRDFRRNGTTRYVPLVVYDARDGGPSMVGLLQQGASDYLWAPLDRGELVEKIRVHARVQALLRSIGRFVPEDYLRLMDRPDLSSVAAGEFAMVKMSVLFTDIRSFTEIAGTLPPQDVFKFLNSLFSRMEPAIRRNRGIIDKYIGDAILALFPGTADDCLKAGLDMFAELALYNVHRARSGYAPVRMGMGMHHGAVALGTVGSAERLNATAVGDTVNLASRVETATKAFSVDLIVTDALRQRLADPGRYHLREIDRVRVKGKQTPIVLYEAFDTNQPDMVGRKTAIMEDYRRAVRLYREGEFAAALEEFNECRRACPGDQILEIYLRRCNALIRVPPGPGWAGTSTL
jgi:class 3 adenylate cyclase